MNNQNQRGRSPDKREEISGYIRQQIVSGLWAPGDLISSRAELEKQFSTTPITVQRAVQPLIEDGQICTKGRKGTFVSESPPHLRRFALVFPHHPDDPIAENGFFKRLRITASELKTNEQLDIECFFGIDGRQDQKDHMELVRQLKRSTFAGIIFAFPPLQLLNTAIVALPEIPRVAFMSGDIGDSIIPIRLAGDSVKNRALHYFKSQNKKRPCFLLHHVDSFGDFCTQLIEQAGTLGMTLRPEWIQVLNQNRLNGNTHLARLLFSDNNNAVPDSIFIADDNAIPYVLEGIQAERAEKAREITVCAQCNLPSDEQYQLPVKRIGFDIPKVLRQAIDMIAANRREHQPLKILTAPACDENELSRRELFSSQDSRYP